MNKHIIGVGRERSELLLQFLHTSLTSLKSTQPFYNSYSNRDLFVGLYESGKNKSVFILNYVEILYVINNWIKWKSIVWFLIKTHKHQNISLRWLTSLYLLLIKYLITKPRDERRVRRDRRARRRRPVPARRARTPHTATPRARTRRTPRQHTPRARTMRTGSLSPGPRTSLCSSRAWLSPTSSPTCNNIL